MVGFWDARGGQHKNGWTTVKKFQRGGGQLAFLHHVKVGETGDGIKYPQLF